VLKKTLISWIILASIVLVGCGSEQEIVNEGEQEGPKVTAGTTIKENSDIVSGCPDAEISWIDVLMINDIKYEGDDEGLPQGETLEKGKQIGEVKYMLAGNACSNHQLKNGDAAFLSAGTEIYELIGYNPDFRVVADNKVYQVSQNKKAKVVSEFLDIEGKVAKLSLESTYDGRHLSDFTEQATAEFIEDLLAQEYLGIDQVYNNIKSDKRVFLRIHLKDGSSFRIVYWIKENALNFGALGTEKMRDIVKDKIEN